MLNIDEHIIPTHNKNITISKTIPNCYIEVNKVIKELLELSMLNNTDQMVLKMKSILPDYISNNSQYEKLDMMLVNTEII